VNKCRAPRGGVIDECNVSLWVDWMKELGRVRVLVVDDNAQMRTIIGTVLAGAGVRHLYYAPEGLRALEAVQYGHPDVVYVDCEMTVMNGLEFISMLRASSTPDRFTPIIMLTGHADLPRLAMARDRGVTEFLVKPVTAHDILRRLEAVILRPRPFVQCASYFGPDRRRRADLDYDGTERRARSPADVVEV
jgi:two-component system chemotaxis response regulator CheY